MEAEEHEKWGRPGLIHHVSDVRWTQGGRDNDVRGRGSTADSSKNCYKWVLIHETWPVQKVQSIGFTTEYETTAMNDFMRSVKHCTQVLIVGAHCIDWSCKLSLPTVT